MFWTAFIWGLGVSCGACFGLLLFILLKSGLDALLNTKAAQASADKAAQASADLATSLLKERNEMMEETNIHLSRIALCLQSAAAETEDIEDTCAHAAAKHMTALAGVTE